MKLSGEKLRLYAFRKNLTQKCIADETGLAFATVNTIFNGRSCTPETALKIARALGVELSNITARV